MKKKQYFLAGIVILVILGIAIAVIFNGRNKNAEENSSSKVVTVVSEEEYQFYSEVVQKDYKEQDQKELEKKTKEYAKEVYAQFALGEAYNLCKPYSYESLRWIWKQKISSVRRKRVQEKLFTVHWNIH